MIWLKILNTTFCWTDLSDVLFFILMSHILHESLVVRKCNRISQDEMWKCQENDITRWKSRVKWFQLSFNFSRKMMVALARKRRALLCTSFVMLKSPRGRFVIRQNTDVLARNLLTQWGWPLLVNVVFVA